MKIGFGCDHAAVELKNTLLEHLKEKGYECVDYGSFDPNAKDNYPEKGVGGRRGHHARRCGQGRVGLRYRRGHLFLPTRCPASVPLCAASPIPLK